MSSEQSDSPNIPDFFLPEIVVRESEVVLKKLKRRYPNLDLSRFEEYRSSINSPKKDKEHGLQRPFMGYYPGLTARPFWEPSDSEVTTSVARELENAASQIRDEYLEATRRQDVLERYGASARYSSLGKDDWSGATLYKDGRFSRLCKAFPITSGVIGRLTPYLVGEVVFLVLRPGVVLPEHTDATNAQLTCHLGLVVPEGCGIKVGDEEREWTEGKVLFFDHSYVHKAWNRGDKGRVVLLLNVRHPDISEEEHLVQRRFLRELKYRVALRQPGLVLRRALGKVRRLF